jgi:hypothetical protein
MLSRIHGPFFQFSASATAIHPWTVWSTPATATSPCISHGDDCALCQCIPTSPHFLEAPPPRLIDVVHALAYILQWALRGLGVKLIHSAPKKMAWACLLAPGWCIARVRGRCMHRYLAVVYIAVATNVF